MKRKLFAVLLIAILVINPAVLHQADAASAKTEQVLVLYDSLAEGTDHAQNVDQLVRLLVGLGRPVTVEADDQYRSGAMHHYDYVIRVANDGGQPATRSIDRDLHRYRGHFLQIGGNPSAALVHDLSLSAPVMHGDTRVTYIRGGHQVTMNRSDMRFVKDGKGVVYGKVSINDQINGCLGILSENKRSGYVADFRAGTIEQFMLADLLKDWLHVAAAGQAYLTLTNITPYTNFKVVAYVTTELHRLGIPYIAVAQPVFANLDSDAMKRYMNLLGDIQKHNGRLFIGAPAVYQVNLNDGGLLKEQMNFFIDTLADYQIAPVGVAAPMYWFFDRQYQKQGLNFFTAAVVQSNSGSISWRERTPTLQKNGGVNLVAVSGKEMSALGKSESTQMSLPVNLSLTYDIRTFDSMNAVKQFFRDVRQTDLPFADFGGHVATVHSRRHVINQENGMLTIDQKPLHWEKIKVADVKKVGSRTDTSQTKVIFGSQNQFLVFLFTGILILFLVFLIVSRRYYKRKYYKD